MKRIVLLASACLAASACSHDRTLQENLGPEVAYRVSLGYSSRANTVSITNMNQFKVTAIGNSQTYFSEEVTSPDNGASWNMSKTYYWPMFSLEFFAFSPSSLNATVNASSQSIVFSPESTVANQKDMVISYASGSKTLSQGGVALNFKHALAQIEIQAKNTNPDLQIEVTGVKISNVKSSGTFTFPRTETSAAYTLQQNAWSNLSGNSEYVISGAPTVTLSAAEESIMFGDNNFLMLPQQLTPWVPTSGNSSSGTYIGVYCCIKDIQGGSTQLYPASGQYAYAQIPINTNWEPGYHYIYTLIFGDGAGYTPDGDEILQNPISFIVTVDQWKEMVPQPDVDM